jgi:hypothetical protein
MTENKSEFYRGRAEELRAVARQLRSDDTRGQLLGIARLFEKLATRIKGREQTREAAD